MNYLQGVKCIVVFKIQEYRSFKMRNIGNLQETNLKIWEKFRINGRECTRAWPTDKHQGSYNISSSDPARAIWLPWRIISLLHWNLYSSTMEENLKQPGSQCPIRTQKSTSGKHKRMTVLAVRIMWFSLNISPFSQILSLQFFFYKKFSKI